MVEGCQNYTWDIVNMLTKYICYKKVITCTSIYNLDLNNVKNMFGSKGEDLDISH